MSLLLDLVCWWVDGAASIGIVTCCVLVVSLSVRCSSWCDPVLGEPCASSVVSASVAVVAMMTGPAIDCVECVSVSEVNCSSGGDVASCVDELTGEVLW